MINRRRPRARAFLARIGAASVPGTGRGRWLASGLAVLGLVLPGLAVTGPAPALAASGAAPAVATSGPAAGYNVYVGYADNFHSNPVSFPSPFDTGNGVVNEGQPGTASLDGGVIRIANATAATETVNSVTVSFGPCTFDLWRHNVSLPFGGQLVLDQTAPGAGNGCAAGTTTGSSTLDSSDIGPNGAAWSSHCTQSGVIPKVTISVDGTAATYSDSGQVLNTGGVDGASCNRPGFPAGNESAQWVSIGSPPCATGATLSLSPSTQTHQLVGDGLLSLLSPGPTPGTAWDGQTPWDGGNGYGDTAKVTATLSACGTPLQGATVNFKVASGPNAGKTGSAVTNANGQATFTYSGKAAGTDTVEATVTNAAGTITSKNNVSVVWQPCTLSILGLCINLGNCVLPGN